LGTGDKGLAINGRAAAEEFALGCPNGSISERGLMEKRYFLS
jgi:hypothetical protein